MEWDDRWVLPEVQRDEPGWGSRSVGSSKASVVKTVTPPLPSSMPVLTPAHPRWATFPTEL